MQHRQRIPAALCSALLALAGTLPTHSQEQDEAQAPPPQPGFVFDGKGQKTDLPAYVTIQPTDVLYPINVNNHWGLMNQRGQIVVLPQFEWTDYSFEDYARYVQGGKTGYLRGKPASDSRSEFFIKARFDYADRFCNGLAVVMNEERWGMIDRVGNDVVPLAYDGVLRLQDGFAAVEKDGRIGFVNRAGRLKIPLQFKRARSFHAGFAAVQLQNGRWGYIDKRGKLVWEDKTGHVTMLGDFHESLARVRYRTDRGERWGYISKAFRFRIDPIYLDANDFHHGMASVRVKQGWGFITAAERWAIDPVLADADSFDDAERSNDYEKQDREDADALAPNMPRTAGVYALVKRGKWWGYINRADNAGLEAQFRWGEPFFRGLARVSRDGSFAYVGERGQVRFDPRAAHKSGIVNMTLREQARVIAGRDLFDQQNNRMIPPPPAREPVEVPYVSEHDYVEMLPAKER